MFQLSKVNYNSINRCSREMSNRLNAEDNFKIVGQVSKCRLAELNIFPHPAECSSCSSCGQKKECGFLGVTESECQQSGCLWCPTSDGSSDPWCIVKSGSSSSGGDSSSSGSCSLSVSNSYPS